MKALALALAAAAIVSTQTDSGATGFTAHEIATGLRGGYQVVVADLNKDGKPDIIAVAQGLPELLWYENPGWRQMIDDQIANGHTIVAVDIDNDGRDEIVVGQRGGARSLMLYTASADGASWSKRVIDDGGMAGAGCAAADLNADKRVDIVCIGTATANLKWYENTGKR